MDGVCRTHAKDKQMNSEIYSENMNGRDHLGDGRIFKCSFKNVCLYSIKCIPNVQHSIEQSTTVS